MKLLGFEKHWAHVAFGVIYPGDEQVGLVGIGQEEETASFVTELCARIPFQSALGFRVAVWIATFAPLFVIGRFALLASLAQTEREKVIGRLLVSESYLLRSLVFILKTMGAMYYGGKAAVRARMSQRPPAMPASGDRLVPLRLKGSSAAA